MDIITNYHIERELCVDALEEIADRFLNDDFQGRVTFRGIIRPKPVRQVYSAHINNGRHK
ncbi:MAG: hypothetical protein HY363_06060 [Candidatus Aenigmarchaeota archaeon]|nr:hypothetical protein [Candidatus Aenigmarchaeota archaeon]